MLMHENFTTVNATKCAQNGRYNTRVTLLCQFVWLEVKLDAGQGSKGSYRKPFGFTAASSRDCLHDST
jgi:hypothetical protein